MQGRDVLLPKVELYLLGFEHPFAPPGPGLVLPARSAVDAFGAATAAVVRELQAQHGVPAICAILVGLRGFC
jgi:hypothetical protein